MQTSADEGALLTLLTRLTGARYAVEVGVFTGYSSLCIARGLAPGGRLLACDTSREWTAVAERFWLRAGIGDRIDLRIGPAIETVSSAGMTVMNGASTDRKIRNSRMRMKRNATSSTSLPVLPWAFC